MALNLFTTSKLVSAQPFNPDSGLSYSQAGQADNPFTPGHWSQSYIIRTILALLITACITLILIRITELVFIWYTPSEQLWKSLLGFIVWQSIEFIGVLFGAMMAAAGRNQMMTLGVLIGITAGFLTLIIFPTNQNISPLLYFAMPAWFTVAGAIGAWIGESVWHPQIRRNIRAISSRSLTQDHHDASISQLIRQTILGMIFANIRWLRIILAIAIILPTLWYTQGLVNWLLIKLNLTAWAAEVGLQKSWVVTMLKIIVVILAAAMCGAGSTHGIAHGFWTGVICGVLNLLLHVFFPPEDGLVVNTILWEVGWVFLLCIVAGGFGALTIPPIMYLAQKRRPTSLR